MYAAIDFGTSNSAIALPLLSGRPAAVAAAAPAGPPMHLVELESGFRTMPTAVFYRADTPAAQREADRLYGRAAVAAYVEGIEGRLMRSMKSILGSSLLEQSTDIGAGRSVRYLDVVTGYLRHLRACAEAEAGVAVRQAVLGRPVYFVDDDPARDAQAQGALAAAARSAGFEHVQFQYEPIAAALDLESRATREQLVLVADIGGGTSDFSLVRIGPQRRGQAERRGDILANHGVHVAGTDFDRRIELASILPLAGYRSLRPPVRPGDPPREVPSGIYFDLATWHLINTTYQPARVAEVRAMKTWYAQPLHHKRLLQVLTHRLGHALAAAAEQGKIDLALRGVADIDLASWETGLQTELRAETTAAALEEDFDRIEQAALETAHQAGMAAAAVDCIYFTGGSTGLASLVDRIGRRFPAAARVQGDRFASVAQGLGWHARALFGPARPRAAARG